MSMNKCERESQEIILQGCSLPQDTSHQYARFASPVSDNGKWIIKFFYICIYIYIYIYICIIKFVYIC